MDTQGTTYLSLDSQSTEMKQEMAAAKQLLLASKQPTFAGQRKRAMSQIPSHTKPYALRGAKSRRNMPVNQPRGSYF